MYHVLRMLVLSCKITFGSVPNLSNYGHFFILCLLQARQTYSDAIAAGQTAFMMEEDDTAGDVFECKVGNLPSHAQAEITFCYVRELDMDRTGIATFTYPCILRERYSATLIHQDGMFFCKNKIKTCLGIISMVNLCYSLKDLIVVIYS